MYECMRAHTQPVNVNALHFTAIYRTLHRSPRCMHTLCCHRHQRRKNPNDMPKFNSIAACNGIESERVFVLDIFLHLHFNYSTVEDENGDDDDNDNDDTHQMKSLTYWCLSKSNAIMFYNALQLLIQFSALIRTILKEQPNIYRFRLFNPNSRLRRLVDWMNGKYGRKKNWQTEF